MIDKRAILLRARARQFAATVKESNMAHSLPDELVDWCQDAEFPQLFEHLRNFGLIQRSHDLKWERA